MPATNQTPKLQAKARVFRGECGNAELLGFADLLIAESFVIKGIRILRTRPGTDGSGEPFVSFPSRKGAGESRGKYFDVAHPVTSQAYQKAREAILESYEEAAGRRGGE